MECLTCENPIPEGAHLCPSCGQSLDPSTRTLEPIEFELAPDYIPAPAYGLAPYDPHGPTLWLTVALLLLGAGLAITLWLFLFPS